MITLYKPICDKWVVIDNKDMAPEVIAEGAGHLEETIINNDIWCTISIQNGN